MGLTLASAALVPLILLLGNVVGDTLPVTGSLVPPPTSLRQSSTFRDAADNLTALLREATNDTRSAGFFVNNASFSVAVTSFSAPADDPILWEHHYLAPERLTNGTNSTDGDSQYLCGSVTKVFTDLLVLKSGIDIKAPVTDFLEELRSTDGEQSTVRWEQITVADLMSHLGGIPQNLGFPEIFTLVPLFQALGFPPVTESAFPTCGVIGLSGACNASSLLANLATAKAIFPPSYSPAYNNLGFAILGVILQRHTGSTFGELLESEILGPLNMTNSGLSPGDTSLAVIPRSDSSWGADFGINAPQGGMYSSTNDLSTFVRAILDASPDILESRSAVDAWLKPRSMLSSVNLLAGAPWEIYRTSPGSLTPDNPHTVDVYAKDGGVVGYFSRIALIPEYGIGVICLTAGPVGTLDAVMEAVLATLVPAVDEAARSQANRTYAGSYVSAGGSVDANLTLQVVDDGPGVRVSGLYRNGSDILEAISTIYYSSPVIAGDLNTDFHIYPAGISRPLNVTTQSGHEEEMLMEDWRLGIEAVRFDQQGLLADLSQGVFADSVGSWQGLDSMYYGGQAVDRFVMIKSRNGSQVRGVRIPSLRVDLWADDP